MSGSSFHTCGPDDVEPRTEPRPRCDAEWHHGLVLAVGCAKCGARSDGKGGETPPTKWPYAPLPSEPDQPSAAVETLARAMGIPGWMPESAKDPYWEALADRVKDAWRHGARVALRVLDPSAGAWKPSGYAVLDNGRFVVGRVRASLEIARELAARRPSTWTVAPIFVGTPL